MFKRKKYVFLSVYAIFITLNTHGFESGNYLFTERVDCGAQFQNKYESAKLRAKELFIAVANADVPKLKKLLTIEYYRQAFPYDDEQLRKSLLSVPYERRQKLIEHISHNVEITTIPNRAGDVVTIIFRNKKTQKDFTVQLIDERGNGDWKVFNYEYYK